MDSRGDCGGGGVVGDGGWGGGRGRGHSDSNKTNGCQFRKNFEYSLTVLLRWFV